MNFDVQSVQLSATSAPRPSASLIGVLSEGEDGGYFVVNSAGSTEIIADAAAKGDLQRLISSKAALVVVEGELKQYGDPRNREQRSVIEATAVLRAGFGSADITCQLFNGESMAFIQGTYGRMPLFGATPEAAAELARFRQSGTGETAMVHLVGDLENGAFQATKVDVLERVGRGPGRGLFPANQSDRPEFPAVGRPRQQP